MSTVTRLICSILLSSLPLGAAAASLIALSRLSEADQLHLAATYAENQYCNYLRPGYKEAAASGYSVWRRNHEAVILEIETMYQSAIKARIDGGKLTSEETTGYVKKCARLERFFVRPHPDPQFATPAETWGLYLRALQSGQRETALDCLVDPALKNLSEIIENEPADFLRQIGTGYGSLRLIQLSDDYASYWVSRKDLVGQLNLRKIDGEWRILSTP